MAGQPVVVTSSYWPSALSYEDTVSPGEFQDEFTIIILSSVCLPLSHAGPGDSNIFTCVAVTERPAGYSHCLTGGTRIHILTILCVTVFHGKLACRREFTKVQIL